MAIGKLNLDNLPRKYQLLIVACLTVALLATGYWFWIKEMVDTRATLKKEIAVLEKSVAQASEVEARLNQFKADLARLDSHLESLRRILPSQKETPDVLRSVQQMAKESNLKIVKFAPQPVAARSFYSDWPISMDVEGSYNALGEFFEKIGQFRRIVNVENISVKGIENSTDPMRTLTSHYTATTFVYREDAAIVTEDPAKVKSAKPVKTVKPAKQE
jgi:type IV pilus assembly protein PilO